MNYNFFYSFLFAFFFSIQATQQVSSYSPKLAGTACSVSSSDDTAKMPSSFSSSVSKGRQPWLDTVNSSSADENVGHSKALAAQVHCPAPSEANSYKASESNLATSESGFLNSLSSDDTSSLSNNQDHLSVPDKPTGSRVMDRGKPRNCMFVFGRQLSG